MPLKWWRRGIPSFLAFGGVVLVSLFVLFGGLLDWFSCFGGGISLFGVVRYFSFLAEGIFVGFEFLLDELSGLELWG